MINLDSLKDQEIEFAKKIQDAVENGNAEELAKVLSDKVEMEVKARKAMDEQGMMDNQILANRGVRMLTSAETNYYNKLIDAMRSSNPKDAVSNIDVTMPETIVDDVMANIKTAHPLLDAVDFVKVNGKFRYQMSTDTFQKAVWGKITDAIVTEIEGGFKEIDLTQKKVTAFCPVSNGMLDLGASYLDAYVRGLLEEALANGMEDAIVNGTGVDQPIGMTKSITEKESDGTAKAKTAVAITTLDLAQVGTLCATLAKNEAGKVRTVSGLILVCNEMDYWSKIMPATSHYTPEGGFIKDLVPGTDCKIIRSQAVATNSAVFGIGKNYFMGIAFDKGGKIEYSDEFKFLDDQRYYKIKAYGNGQAKDNNDFIVLDVTNLEPWVMEVKSKSSSK